MTHSTSKQFCIGIGWLYCQSRARACDSHPHRPHHPVSQGKDDDQEIGIGFVPAQWFGSKGFFFRAARSWGLWQYSFRPSRVVSNKTLFDAAEQGNISLIKQLLDDREVTFYDTSKGGWNLLHVGFCWLTIDLY